MSPARNAGLPGVGSLAGVEAIDQRAALVGVDGEISAGDRRIVELGIGVKASPIFVGEFLGFDEVMDVVRAAESGAAKIESFEQLQHFEHGDALAVGR